MIPISCKISWINATQEHDQLNSNKGLISHCSTRSVLGRVTCLESLNIAVSNVCDQRLRWSRGSELPLSTQVRGLKPDRSRQDFQGRKIFSAPSFGGEVKPSVPCRRFTACKRSLNATWKSGISGKIHRPFLAHIVPLLATRISGETTSGESWNV